MKPLTLRTGLYLLISCCCYPLLLAQLPYLNSRLDSLLPTVDIPVLAYEKSLDPTGANTTVITSDDILARGYDNLDELLSSIPGVFITHDRISTQIGMRGMSPTEQNNQRILILLDNIPINNPLSGQAPSGYELKGIAVEDIAEVVVTRSPMSVLYGNNALLGVIKITTKPARKGVRLNFDIGSFGELDGGFALGQTFGKTTVGFTGRIASVVGQALYFPELSGFVEHGDEMNYRGFQVNVRHGRFALRGSYTRRSGRIATAPDSSFPLDDRGSYDEQQIFADISYAGSPGENQSNYTHVFLNYNQNDRVLFYEPTDTFQEKRFQDAIWTGAEYQHLFELNDNHQLLAGTEFWYLLDASYASEGGVGTGSEQSFTQWNYGLFVHDSYQFNDQVGIAGGIRMDINSRADLQLMPQVAFNFQPGEASVIRLGFSRGYRLPSLLETEVDRIGSPFSDPDLLPEYANSVEMGWKQQISETLQLNLGLYFQQLDQLIDNNDLFEYANEQAENFSGLDGGLLIELGKGVQSYINYNLPFSNDQAINLPSQLCKFGVTVPFLQHFSLFAEGQYEGGRSTVEGLQTQSFFLLNANLLIRPQIKEPSKAMRWLNQSSLAFRLYNALDQFYQHPAGLNIIPRFVAQNGRTWQAQLTLSF